MINEFTLQEVKKAYSLVKSHLIRTPLIFSPEFSQSTGNNVYFKVEVFQRTHAFKVRGALNKIVSLSPSQRERGVIAASSGNHALGVAYSSSLLGIEATVIMPARSPAIKVKLAKQYGAKVLLHGETYDDAAAHVRDLSIKLNKVPVSSFDDLKVISGQGTIALEVLEDLPDVELFLVPIGGGSLASGLLLTLFKLGHPAKVIGVEAQGAPKMLASMRAGKRIKLPHIDTIADGIALKEPGALTFEIIKSSINKILTVTDQQIYSAMSRMLYDMRLIIEPAAAAPVAAMIYDVSLQNLGQSVCCVITGGNISNSLLQQIVLSQQYPSDTWAS